MEVDSVTLAEIKPWDPLLPNFLWVLGLGGLISECEGSSSWVCSPFRRASVRALRTSETDVILQPANCHWYQKIRNKGRIEAYLPPCGWKSEGWRGGGSKWPHISLR